jgi:hypothetical protein
MHRHRLRSTAAPALVTLAALLVAACGTPAASPLTDPNAILKAALTTTAAATSFHLDLAADGSLSLDLTGTGSAAAPMQLDDTTLNADVDIAGGDAKATFAIPGLLGLAGEAILLDGTAYYKTTLTGPLYQTQTLGDVEPDLPSPDPSAIAEMVAELDEFLAQPGVDPVKGADVDCGGTTCYTVEIELTPEELAAMGDGAEAPIPSGLPLPVPLPDLGDASIDLTIRVEQDTTQLAGVTAVIGIGEAGEITADLTFSKWNEGVSISAPPADQVQGGS